METSLQPVKLEYDILDQDGFLVTKEAVFSSNSEAMEFVRRMDSKLVSKPVITVIE